jgi:predicted ester cyclase
MSPQEGRAFILQVWDELITRKNLNAVDELFSPRYILHTTAPFTAKPLDLVKMALREMHTGFPDLRVEVTHLLVDGDLIATREIWRGTHLGPFRGIAPTGKNITRTTMHIVRMEAGKIIEEWTEGTPLVQLLSP